MASNRVTREGFAGKGTNAKGADRVSGPVGAKAREGKVESVAQKGLRLFREGRVRHVIGDKWTVLGENGRYEVDAEKQLCECPSRVYCSHRYAVSVAVAKRNAATRRRMEAQRASGSERFLFTAEEVERNIARLEKMGA